MLVSAESFQSGAFLGSGSCTDWQVTVTQAVTHR